MSSTVIVLSFLAATCLYPHNANSEIQVRRDDLAAPPAPDVHEPASKPERALDSVIRLGDRDEDGARLYSFAVKDPSRDKTDDKLFAPLFSWKLQSSWEQTERKLVKENCRGHYISGEACGLESSPVTCGQDHSDIGYLYRTLREDTASAIIEMRWVEHPADPVATYRMVRSSGRWVLDGVACENGYRFNWK